MLTPEQLGFIGLGNMGGAIALRLLRAGYPLTVLDLGEKKCSRFYTMARWKLRRRRTKSPIIDHRHRFAPSRRRRESCPGQNGIAKAQQRRLCLRRSQQHRSGAGDQNIQALRQRGIEMLDSPLSGADIGATNGNLTLFVGGSYQAFQRACRCCNIIGRMVTYLGKNGNGQIGKTDQSDDADVLRTGDLRRIATGREDGSRSESFARAASAGCAQSWRLDELVNGVFNLGDKRYRLNLRPERTGRAMELAGKAGIALPGAAATHRLFAERGWEVVIDFAAGKIIEPGKA